MEIADAGGGQERYRLVVLTVLVALLKATSAAGGGTCGLAELTCRDGHCVPLDAYCNGRDDCGDGSDEPALCTPCNRTYHGQEGRTYKLELPRPVEGRLPFFCHLTFTAGGHGHGELVQLLWDAFSIGRLDSTAADFALGCPEGSLQLAELGRPFTGGFWCGAGEGRASYYSETSTVTASIRLFHAPPSVPFKFRLRYRFVSRNEAIARLGKPEMPIERGSPVPGTYCSRNFYECHQKQCRVQSPNYPGEYPRNASCLITLRQKEVPTCKHAMISVRASPTGPVGLAINNSTLSVWQDCPFDRDRLIFRDGSRLEDPILLIYCGGPLPRITARGTTMLVEFRSSPLAMPLGASALRIELDVQVVYVDSDGLDYARGPQGCHFFVNETAKRSGVLRAPLHALPPGSSCTWNIKGATGDRIWIYFSSYSQRDLTGALENNATSTQVDSGCAVKVSFFDGTPMTGLPMVTLCDETPKLCAHAALRNATRMTRPCTSDESYFTVTPSLTLRMETVLGTTLHTVNFQARYEFVSTLQGGEAWGNGPCSRIWRRVRSGEVTSPRDVRLFGRGGASRLECKYRIEAGSGERIRLTLHNVSLGEQTSCTSEPDPHTGRPRCINDINSREAHLILYEAPWRDVKLPRACLCDNTSHLPLTHISAARALEITFVVDQQAPHEDFETLFFYASFELIRAPECPRKQRVRGEGGELRFVAPPLSRPDIYCEGLPWLIEARENRSLFVLTWGWFLPLEPPPVTESSDIPKCPTTNRILLYSAWASKLLKVICPAEPGAREYTVHVFSEEWLGGAEGKWPGPPKPPALLLDFVAREPGQAAASWLEISKSRSALRRQLRLPERGVENETVTNGDCPHRCPELGACIASSLWCDGRIHCPSGHDEAQCGNGARLLGLLPPTMWLVVAGVAGIVTASACLLVILIGRSRARARRLHYKGKKTCNKPRRAPTEETLLGAAS